jgi:hypothetical protein
MTDDVKHTTTNNMRTSVTSKPIIPDRGVLVYDGETIRPKMIK